MIKVPTMLKFAATGALALSAVAAMAGSASAQSWYGRGYGYGYGYGYGRHYEPRDRQLVRCDRDGDDCVVLRCDDDGDDCVTVRRFHRDRGDYWRRSFGWGASYRGWSDGRWSWYGDRRVRCDRDGDRCWVARY